VLSINIICYHQHQKHPSWQQTLQGRSSAMSKQ